MVLVMVLALHVLLLLLLLLQSELALHLQFVLLKEQLLPRQQQPLWQPLVQGVDWFQEQLWVEFLLQRAVPFPA